MDMEAINDKKVEEELKEFQGIIREIRFASNDLRTFNGINIETHAYIVLEDIPDRLEREVAYSFARYVNLPMIIFDLSDGAREMWELHLKRDEKETYFVQQQNRLRLKFISQVIGGLKRIDDLFYQHIYPVDGVDEIWPEIARASYGNKSMEEKLNIAERTTQIARSAYEKVVKNL